MGILPLFAVRGAQATVATASAAAIEMMAIGVPYIRIEYKSEIHEAFIPNYHYITIPREHAFLEFDKNGVTKREKIFPGIGRVRDVNIGPDGYAYISVEAIGIFKILPK